MMIEYGLWDQVRTDKGKEWVLGLYIQEQLASHRTNTLRAPHLQTTSKQASIIMIILNSVACCMILPCTVYYAYTCNSHVF